MAKQNAQDFNSDGVVTDSDTIKRTLLGEGALDLADIIMDGATFAEKTVNPNSPFAMAKVVKLKPGQGIMGKFAGYEPVMISKPDAKPDEAPNLMDYVGVEVNIPGKPALLVKILGTAQIMQQMQVARPGDTVGIYRGTEPDIELPGGRRVKVYHVAIQTTSLAGGMRSLPAGGKWGQAAAQAAALGAGDRQPVAALPQGGKTVDSK
jgi:hypothetical protein